MKPQITSFGKFSLFRGILAIPVTWLLLLFPVLLPVRTALAEDLMQIYTLAKEQDPAFRRETFRHEAAPETLNQAYAELIPTVNADAFYRRSRQEILSTDIAVYETTIARYPAKGYTLSLVQPLLKLSSIYRVMQAKEEVRRADFKFEAAKQELLLRVAEAYSTVLEAQDSLSFTLAEEAAVRRHFELAQIRYRSGLAPVTDFHDAKARLADTMALKVKAENRLEDSLEALAEITGKKIKNVAKLKSSAIGVGVSSEKTREVVGTGMPLVSPEPDSVESWMEAAPKQNLDVEVQRQAVQVAEKEIERQKAGHAPVLSVVGRLNKDDEGGSLFGGESDVMTREAYVQLTFPLFQGFSVVSKTREAVKLWSAAKADLEKEIRGVRRTAKASFLGVKSSIQNVEAFRESVLSNQIALEAKREGFKSGLFPALAVLDAERDLHRAKQDYARAHYEYVVHSLRLKKAVGTLSEEDLASINEWME
ncbi:MAG: TolC family outer membrane protein [Thermodesulfobacteriota bacterium]